ncbi:MAG TPA: hypothetical protein VF516_10425 [Kofleriaceae bacterium]
MAAIEAAIANHPVAGLLIAPVVLLVCFGALCGMAPFGLIVGMVVGIDPAWQERLGWLRWLGWGPWGGRLVFMGLTAGLIALVIAGRWLEKRNPVPNGDDDTPRVPSARAVTAHLFTTVPWKQLIGPILLVIAGAGFLCLGCFGLAMSGMLDA